MTWKPATAADWEVGAVTRRRKQKLSGRSGEVAAERRRGVLRHLNSGKSIVAAICADSPHLLSALGTVEAESVREGGRARASLAYWRGRTVTDRKVLWSSVHLQSSVLWESVVSIVTKTHIRHSISE